MDERARQLDSSKARMTTAVHEAAHAVVSLRLDLPVNGLTLRPASVSDADGADDDSFVSMLGSLGLSLPAGYSDERYPELARGKIVSLLAGPLAEIRISGTVDVMGSLGDIMEAVATAEALSEDRGALTLGRECQREASEIVTQDWATILSVAAELVGTPTGVLDGDDGREAVRRAERMPRP